MGYNFGAWGDYVPVGERRLQAQRKIAELRKKGRDIAPVEIEDRKIAKTFWGKAWCDNLESYRDPEYLYRLPRGRCYVRNGLVVDLQIAPKMITGQVLGSSLYQVVIAIKALPPARWRSICRDCAGAIDTLVELLQGRFSQKTMARLCRQDGGLFPKPEEIEFSCTCPDSAFMCKHVAAALYGVGTRLDRSPELLFRLRAVEAADLLAGIDTALPAAAHAPASDRILKSDDVSALFDIDMAPTDERPQAAASPTAPPAPHKAQRRRPIEKPTDEDEKTEALLADFERTAILSTYRRLRATSGQSDAVRDRALALLKKSFDGRRRLAPADRTARIEMYIVLTKNEGLLAEAWTAVRKYGCTDRVLLSLAKRSEKTQPAEAAKAYRRLVEQCISMGGDANREAALDMIRRMKAIHRKLGTLDKQAALLAELERRAHECARRTRKRPSKS
jgi:uncharacterized Zn finger protein